MYIVVDENQTKINKSVIKTIPELRGEYRIEFDFMMMQPKTLEDRAYHMFEIVLQNGKYLAGMEVKKQPEIYYYTRGFQVRGYGAVYATSGAIMSVIGENWALVFGKWSHFSLVRSKKGSHYRLALYIENFKVAESGPMTWGDNYSNAIVTSGYNQTKLTLDNSYLKNFYVYNKEPVQRVN